MYKLNAPTMLDPRWFNLMRNGAQEGIAISEYEIEVHGQVLSLANSSQITLTPQQKVIVLLTNHFYMETEDAQRERQARVEAEQQRRKEERRLELSRDREESEAFNATLNVPVRWLTAIKDVLSGLSEQSMGNGYNAATVEHIWLQEDLHEGKLHRNRLDFLCTTPSNDNGKQWSGQPETIAFDGEGRQYQPKVTCKSCLKIAQRWR